VVNRRLLERDAHLDLLDVALDEARRGTGRVVWIEGAAGVGKTSLVDAAIDRATASGMTTLVATGDEFESELAWGIVFQLFERPLRRLDDDDRARLFAGPAHHAAPLLLEGRGFEDPVGDEPPADDPVAASTALQVTAAHHGLQWLVANFAERQPLLIVVDDLQWSDASSLGFIAYLARRIQDMPVVLLLSSRVGTDNATTRRRERLRREPLVHRLVPPALSAAAVAELVRAIRPDADADLIAAAHHATGGNAFLVEVVVDLIAAAGDQVDREFTDRLEVATSDDLLHEVDVRLLALPAGAAALARWIAILGPSVAEPVLVALLGDDQGAIQGPINDLVGGDWIEVDADVVRFRHPIIRAAVVALVDPRELGALHDRVADVLIDRDRPAEEIVPHLLAGRPRGSATSASILLSAAERARRSGAPEMALTLLRRAAIEPPPPDLVGAVRRALARSAAAANAPDLGRLFAEAIAVTNEPHDRARLHYQASRALATQRLHGESVAALERAMAEDDGEDPIFSAELDAAHLVALRMDPERRLEWRPRLDALVQKGTGGGAVGHALAAELAYEHGVSGKDFDAARRLALSAVEGEAGTALAFANPMAWATAMHAVHQVNEFERGASVAGDVLRLAQQAGSRATYVLASSYLAVHLLRLGRLTDALAALGEIDAVASASMSVFVPLNAATLSQIYLLTGRHDDARRALDLPGGPDRYRQELTFGGIPEAMGWLHLAEGEPDRARWLFEQIAIGFEGVGSSHPSTTSWRSGAARAHALLGEGAQARALSDEELELARAWGAPRAVGRALTTAGLVHAGSRGLRLFDEAVDVLVGSEAVLDLAEAHLERGLRRSELRRIVPARDDLRVALDLAHRHGAELLAARAETGLRDAGARPRARATTGVAALTPSELRVATMAAAGHRNNDIAAELFVSRKAVEYHLSNVYRKLHLDGRAGLAAALTPSIDP
jgi:DNA-binding CsgD family transcriptional regulator